MPSNKRAATPSIAEALEALPAEDEFAAELEAARKLRGARAIPKRAEPPMTPLGPPGIDIMVIGDSHAGPGQSLRRYRWFGKMAAALRPAAIVDIGDWASMDSCSVFDRPGSTRFAARSFWADVDAAVAARDVFTNEVAKARGYKPKLHGLIGNHEYRILKVGEADSRFTDLFTLDVLRHREFGWTRHEFLEPLRLAGFSFVHYLTNPGTGKPIGGVGANPLRLAWQKVKVPCVVGHSHRKGHWRETDMYGRAHDLFNAGCAFEHDEEWADTDNRYWDRGILILRNAKDGMADGEWWSLERIRRAFG